MGKIKFENYLKSKQQPVRNYESDESLVRRARLKMSVDSMVVSPEYRVKNLEAAEEMLSDAKDFPGASSLREECGKLLGEARTAQKEAEYKRACLHFEEAKEQHEFEKVRDELLALRGYKDADKKRADADARAKQLNRKFQIKRGIVLAVIAAIVVLLVKGAQAGYLNYAAARLEGLGGQYKSAYSRFMKLGDLLDSKELADKYHSLYLRQREKAEKKALPDARKGDTVTYAGESWLVLRRRDRKLLLICSGPDEDSVFRNVQYNNVREDVTWEDSSLREFLNNGALKEEFTELEQKALIEMEYSPSGNPDYGTGMPDKDAASANGSSGSAAVLKDKVRIFSMEDLKSYKKVFKAPGVDMWLATPGHDLSSAAYQSKSGTVMSYGDDVTDMNLSACPVIWVDLDVLAGAEQG